MPTYFRVFRPLFLSLITCAIALSASFLAPAQAAQDAKTEAEGKADKAEGRVQNAVGGMKDSARDARDKVTGKE